MMLLRRFAEFLRGNTAKSKTIYVRNVFRLGKFPNTRRFTGGILIRRIGWLNSARRLGIGQDKEILE